MGSNESDKYPLFFEVELSHKSEGITLNIEDNSALFQNAGVGISLFNIIWIFPIRAFDSVKPGFQVLF